ncbi:Asp-tRNA(Asn)/Glu-tRNA(Gln) amidotransferase subunit GatC [Candidatus Dojkabacteria bacterium]|uniref:Aspartyl/glutamyl-tRNA(Asn/Gln) amidotransferase subunit C n=1 Tax=Candidatus Dojkabacteria bacterium TaxID=2099670 RepID=A0A955I5P7_9BACT|nr:Asp-tRNA(Asn)/Glu-tRNA(Gln) amidotransferase subunit GatC [Candidatus Dojkabacteria bacterium]
MAKLSKAQIKKISELAKLELTDAELDKFAGEISEILDYVEQLQDEDVSDISATTNLLDFDGQVLRADEAGEPLPITKILQNATDGRSTKHEFVTSQIVGGEE